jgi:hypothetical protein
VAYVTSARLAPAPETAAPAEGAVPPAPDRSPAVVP